MIFKPKHQPRVFQAKMVRKATSDYTKFGLSMVESATGTGKTWLSYFLVHQLFSTKKARILVSVPSVALVHQSLKSLNDKKEGLFPDARTTLDTRSHKKAALGRIEFSFRTRQGAQKELLASLEENKPIDLFVLDECHNGLSNTYTQIADTLLRGINEKVIRGALFLSATPWKLEHPLAKMLENHTHRYSTLDAIQDGILVNPMIVEYNTSEEFRVSDGSKHAQKKSKDGAKICARKKVNTKHLKSKRALERSVMYAGPRVAIEYLKLNKKLSPIIIRVDSAIRAEKQWKVAVEVFGELGISPELIQHDVGSGNDAPSARRGGPIFDRRGKIKPGKEEWIENGKPLTYQKLFRNGIIKVYITCKRGGEGFDFPAASILIMTFPPKSEKMDAQNSGRVLRIDEDKNIAYIFRPISIADHLSVKINHQTMEVNPEILSECGKNKRAKNFQKATMHSRVHQSLRLGERDKEGNIVLKKDAYVPKPKFGKIKGKKKGEQPILYSAGPLCIVHAANTTNAPENTYLLTTLMKRVAAANDPEFHKQQIKDFFKKNKHFPTQSDKEKLEKRLGKLLHYYCSPKSGSGYDRTFDEWARSNGYGTDAVSLKKSSVKQFFEKYKRFPNKHSMDLEERKLGHCFGSYCRKDHKSYDSEFDRWARSNGYAVDTVLIAKVQIKDFFKINSRLPSQHSLVKEERTLGVRLSNYCNSHRASYDSEFDRWARSRDYRKDTAKENKREIRRFFKIHREFPKENSSNMKEKKLGSAISRYCASSSGSYDSEFDRWARSNGYGMNTATRNKLEIKKFFKNYKYLPDRTHKLYGRMAEYCRNNRGSYDFKFDRWARSKGYGKR
jgi:superfamily II DNA or RNA helicase